MKYSTLCSLFLTIAFLSGINGASYSCKVDGIYNILDDPNNPLLPTTSQKTWAAGKIKSSYNAVHSVYNNDFTVGNITVVGFDYSPARRLGEDPNQETLIVDSPLPRLRGNRDMSNAAQWIKWRMRLRSKNSVACRLCSNWDDDDALRATVDIDATATHTRWEAAWCDELQQGGVAVFEYAMACTIDLYDCTLITEEAPIANSGITGTAKTVATGMEDIANEAAAEMVVPGVNQK